MNGKMKELDEKGWPAFGLGFGTWTTVSRRGAVTWGRLTYRSDELAKLKGKRVFVTIPRDCQVKVYDEQLVLIVELAPDGVVPAGCNHERLMAAF
jgi:hypothetical protein